MSHRPRRYKRYLDEPDLEIPKRTKNRWRAEANCVPEQQEEADVDAHSQPDTEGIYQPENHCNSSEDEAEDPWFPDLEEDREADASSDHDATEVVPDVGYRDLPDDPCQLDDDAGEEDTDYPIDDSEEEDNFVDAVEELNQEPCILLGENGGDAPEECPPLYDGATITEPLSSLAIMAFALRHSLTKVAVRDLLQLINIHLPVSCLPETFYLFSKNFDERTQEIEFHAYCKSCLNYLGVDCILSCTVCGTNNLRKSDLIKDGFYFMILPLSSQLHDVMETPSLTKYFLNKEHIELIWNCDGMPAFQSGKGSVWPIQCMVKALPPNIQKKHILINGLWFGTCKPRFSTFLKPFVEECHNLAETGVAWTDTSTNVQYHTKVFASLCACDSVARCQLQGISQFNGHFGCSWCLHEGVVVPKGRGHVMTYPYDYPPPAKRSQRGMEDQAIRLNSGLFPEQGVKDISPLLVLPRFDIAKSFPVDYMHAVCEGVGQHLLNLWFDRTHHDKSWFIGNHLNEVDEKIASINPPDDITRLPRSPSQRVHWKASEFRSWILFYALPVLKGVLPSRYLAHMVLLVHAVWVLLQESVTEDEIAMCEIILVKFVLQMKELYGAHYLSYNVHQLLHLADTVRNCGPLWSNSCFPFEGYNRKIKSLFHGTRYIQAQIAQNFTLLQVLRNQVERLPVNTPHTSLKCVEGLLRGYPITVKAVSLRCEDLHLLLMGNPCNYEPPPAIKTALQAYFTVGVEELTFHKFSSVVRNGRIFRVAKTTGRRKNCYISYGSDRVGEIKAIVKITGQEGVKVALVLSEKKIKKCNFGSDQQTGADASHICQISDYQEEVRVVKLITAKFMKCVTAKFDNRTYCMRLPNCVELD